MAAAQPLPQLDLVEDSRLAARMLHPLRLRILEGLREPASASELARRFELPRQRVHYHLHELEKAGLVETVSKRRKGNCLERVVRAKASHFLIHPSALGGIGADPKRMADRFSESYLLAVAAQTIRDVATLRTKAQAAGKKIATLTIQTDVRFASAADRQAFADELADALAKLTAKYHDEKTPGGRTFRVVVASHPAPKE